MFVRKLGRSPLVPPAPDTALVVIEVVTPDVDGGRFAAKRIVGDRVRVEADVFAHGHDEIRAVLQHRRVDDPAWQEQEMHLLVNDRWAADFTIDAAGNYEFTILAWVDPYRSWARDFRRWAEAQDSGLAVEAEVGARLASTAARKATPRDASRLRAWAKRLRGPLGKRDLARLDELHRLIAPYADRRRATRLARPRPILAERERAGCSAWYELFPRSTSPEPGRAGTLADVSARLPYIAELGFDVLYLPPIHPIGTTHRKGRDNAAATGPEDPGSPWAIGGAEGGHTAVDPGLGTVDDVRLLAKEAASYGIELALDLAFQCSPDHPWVREHPQWFRARPDGSIRYAENPPKRYEDIYPVDFETTDRAALWDALFDVVQFWMDQGVRIFRVDNPHTKPFGFWEWLIARAKAVDTDVLFLAEAFTRPKVMHRLAKIGFSQSYTYFTWRNSAWELREYFTELTCGPGRQYFRPNVWPNTPDILHEFLQTGGRPAFAIRLLLAGLLSANYGIYGPAFELLEHTPRAPGSEEYLHSEKYEIRHWDLEAADSLRALVSRVNRIRAEHPALRRDTGLHFHDVDNDSLLVWSKRTPALTDVVLTVANVDPRSAQSGWIRLDLAEIGVAAGQRFVVHDLLTDARYEWSGAVNYVSLDPDSQPAHVFSVTPLGNGLR
jgi:starch synthase (maltosyl-transferring)